jgi:hypothetical protein
MKGCTAFSNDCFVFQGGVPRNKMDHLVCFMPGMLALGATHIPSRKDDLLLAEQLAGKYSFFLVTLSIVLNFVEFDQTYLSSDFLP